MAIFVSCPQSEHTSRIIHVCRMIRHTWMITNLKLCDSFGLYKLWLIPHLHLNFWTVALVHKLNWGDRVPVPCWRLKKIYTGKFNRINKHSKLQVNNPVGHAYLTSLCETWHCIWLAYPWCIQQRYVTRSVLRCVALHVCKKHRAMYQDYSSQLITITSFLSLFKFNFIGSET